MSVLAATAVVLPPRVTAARESLRLKLCCAMGLVIAISFAFVSFRSAAAIETMEAEENQFHLSENKAADQQRDVTTNSVIGFFLLGGAGMLSFRLPAQGQRLSGALWWGVLLFIGWVFLSVLWADEKVFTLRKLVIFGLFLTAAIGFTRALTLKEFAVVVGGVSFTYMLLGLLAEMKIGAFTPWRHYYRFSGTVHPNEQGLYCAFAGLAAMLLRGRQTKAVALGGQIVFWSSALLLLLTKSRTGLAAVLVALALGTLLRADAKKKFLTLLFSFFTLSLGLLLLGATGNAGSRDLGEMASLGRGEHVTSLTGRLPLWAELWDRASDRPWTGYGFSGFWTADHIEEISDIFYWHIPSGHSIYLDLMLTLGLVGLLLYLAMIFLGIGRALAVHRRTSQPELVFAVSVLLMSLVHGCAESKFVGVGFCAFATYGLLLSLARTETRVQPKMEVAP